MNNAFVHLHTHTDNSLLDGMCRVDALVKKAKELGQTAVAITDHGVMYGALEFYNCAKKEGIKPIIGCEVYTARRTRFDKEHKIDSGYGHLTLLAKNNVGYQNLVKLVSLASLEGFYYKPRVDVDLLKEYSEGLIALSGCLKGDIAQCILNADEQKLDETINTYIEVFGRENFYLELQDHNIPKQKEVNQKLLHLSIKYNLKLVATNDVHYIEKYDAPDHDVLLCVQTATNLSDEKRMKFETQEYYFKSADEMTALFSDYNGAVANTVKIADECNVNFEFNQYHLPKFVAPDGKNSTAYLLELCEQGVQKRYPNITEEITKRLEYELEIINVTGFTDYFLVVWDFIKYAKDHKIPVGPGRGSAAGSLVSYVLNITDIDPIKHKLLFERFLNRERISMPDIDIDFCNRRRGEVIEYVTAKYSKNNVAQIITFGTLGAKAAVRDIGRALGTPYEVCDTVAKLIGFGMTIDYALEKVDKLKELYRTRPDIKNLIDISRKLEGLKRHASTHAAGIVISQEPLIELVPLQNTDTGVVTQFSMKEIEQLGLLKMDFLGLKNLTIIDDTIKLVKKSQQIELDITSIGDDLKGVYEMLSRGDTDGVFQLESAGMRSFLRDLKPSAFEDIVAAVALYRPGPVEQIPKFIKNKKTPSEVRYLTPRLKDILSVTYGCIVYQEQVMEIFRVLANYSLGKADMVRRAISKKQKNILLKEREDFVFGCMSNGIDSKVANEIFDILIAFADYAFNKSHAAAYAVIAYQTAYLKLKYPKEFFAAVLNATIDFGDKLAYYMGALKSYDFAILNPDINSSFERFSVDEKGILYALCAIKNVGLNIANEIVIDRNLNGNFTDVKDFIVRLSSRGLNKGAFESLIKAGCFDKMCGRMTLLKNYENLISEYTKKDSLKGQINFFQEKTEQPLVVLDDKQYSNTILEMEKEVLGIYVSHNPLKEPQKKPDLKNKDDRLYLKIEDEESEIFFEAKELLKENKGKNPVYIYSEKVGLKMADKSLWVSINEELSDKLSALLGDENVKIVKNT